MMDQVIVYYYRGIETVTDLSAGLEIPDRWYQAIIENFALKLMLSVPGADLSRYDRVKAEAQRSLADALIEEVDKTPSQIVPNISCYTC